MEFLKYMVALLGSEDLDLDRESEFFSIFYGVGVLIGLSAFTKYS